MSKRKPKLIQHKLPGSKFLFLLKKNPVISPIPFSFYSPFTDKPVFDEKVKNCILKVTKPYQLTKKQ